MTDIIERIERGETKLAISQNKKVTTFAEVEQIGKQDVLDRAEILRLAKVGQTMQWIPVSDPRLVPFRVIVKYRHGIAEGVYYDGKFMRNLDGRNEFPSVTHYMPLAVLFEMPEKERETGESK